MKQNNNNGILQKPIHSGFNASTTSEEVIKDVNLNGKIAIVTGGNSGIGLETVRKLSQAGATVIVPARDVEKAKKNLQNINNIEIEKMDLMNPNSIDIFAEKFLNSKRPLHLLINNAGIMWVPLRRDNRGIESQLATNYLAEFQLCAKLFPALKRANGARVVNVSSQGHQFAPFNFEDPNFESREYETLQAYGQSKTALILFSLEMDNRVREHNIRVFSLHPGSIGGTDLAREAPLELFIKMGFADEKGNMKPEVLSNLKSISQGAATTLWCATNSKLNNLGGIYCEDVEVADINLSDNFSSGVKTYALNEETAKKLWAWSEEITNIHFKIY